ncbi:unnamed protein product [Rotaria sordida]|uniref:Uncharacterized protein n=1 Tax=Rotaria sordida TaxID=392033 RepID=A0A819H3T9_9BILA|nr:unnamed protein product [Rotaria sordida]
MSLVRVKSQFCNGISQYGRCSTNSACACYHIAGATDIGICADEVVNCAELVACEHSSNLCYDRNHRCVHHPQCHNLPVCYPVPSFNRQLCPPIPTMNNTTISTIPIITATTTTTTTTATQQLGDKNGTIVAGGNGDGVGLNQFKWPTYIFVDQQETVYVSDTDNHRVMKWNKGAKEGIVVAGGQGHGKTLTQLWNPNGLFHPPSATVIRRRRVIESIYIDVQQKKNIFKKFIDLFYGTQPSMIYELGLKFLYVYDGLFNYREGHMVNVDCQLDEHGPQLTLIFNYKNQLTFVQV